MGRGFLLDVTRLTWRYWAGRLPTGIDRVCLAYTSWFGSRSHAVLQKNGMHLILSPAASDQLFDLLTRSANQSRLALIRTLATALPSAQRSPPRSNMIYLNVGHTGLDDPALPGWVERNRVKAVYLIHDLIPLTHPEFCRAGEAAKHARRMENLLASAQGVIGNSQATLDELAAFAKGRGLFLPDSVAAWISGVRPTEGAKPRSLERPHFVALGTVEGRKNHILLLQVWRRLVALLGEEAPILLIIGQRGWEAQAATAMLDRLPELNGHVRELGRCDDEELAGWLGSARALLMPSFAEGFGLPIIEALQLGTPVIATDLPVYREIAADIPLYLDPLDGPAWEGAIIEYRQGSPDRDRQLERMRSYRAPDWASHFATVEKWLKQL